MKRGSLITEKSEIKHKTAYFILGLVVLSIFQIVVIAQPEGWILSGRIHMDGR